MLVKADNSDNLAYRTWIRHLLMGLLALASVVLMIIAYIYFINFQEYSGRDPEGPDSQSFQNNFEYNYQGVLGLYRLTRAPSSQDGIQVSQ